MTQQNIAREILFGVAVGDALGVPVEFMERDVIRRNPITGMRGHGTHQQLPGTWSDDSSLTFCLAEMLMGRFSLNKLADYFVAWQQDGFWTARGKVFDIGNATAFALDRLCSGIAPECAGGEGEDENGNGSLMRILPLVCYIAEKPIQERFRITQQVSSLTHRHIRSVIACFYYLEFARQLLSRKDKFEIYKNLQVGTLIFLRAQNIDELEISHFNKLLQADIHEQSEDTISSSGYVIDTLEASIWCLLTTDSFSEAVLKAVNLGKDTDTVGAVTGGLAALLYGYDAIPRAWVDALARKDDVEALTKRLDSKFNFGR